MRLNYNQQFQGMSKFILVLLVSVFSFGFLSAQSVEEEIEFKYIKAKYLLDTERYEDAIKAFTEIIKQDESYSDALILRAQSKYAMAAYRGTKKDVLLFAVKNGFTKEALMLLGKSDYKMGNSDAAINSLSLASQLIDDDAQIDEFLGNLYEESDRLEDACAAWQKAANMGSSKASIKAKKNCGDFEKVKKKKKTKIKKPSSKMDGSTLPSKSKIDPAPENEEDDEMGGSMEDTRTEEQKRRDEDDSLNNPTKESSVDSESEDEKEDDPVSEDEDEVVEELDEDEEENIPAEDNTPNEIEIDEDLTLIIRGQGLGKRRVLDQPNILILSDEDGTVSIDICVNKRGKVESAEFNSKLSTIAKKSLVSLAIRKSKDFWFEKSDYKEQCGVIMFKIKGS